MSLPRLATTLSSRFWPYLLLLVPLLVIAWAQHQSTLEIRQLLAPLRSASSITLGGSSNALGAANLASDILTYRKHLEATTSHPSQLVHSPTLTFSKILVLSLPTRLDRRDQMTKITTGLGLEVEFVDAASKDEPFFEWISERVAETRKLRAEVMAKARGTRPSSIGGLKLGSDWLTPWLSPDSRTLFPPHPNNWVAKLEDAFETDTLASLRPSRSNLNLTKLLWDPREKLPARQLNRGVLSTFWGHTRALRKVVDEQLESALILEDDVDVEWDLGRLWSRVELNLPQNWDTVYLGHCWGAETSRPQYLHPLLYQSTAPMCLHAWAVSLKGARRLLELVNNPWSAYLTAVDLTIPSFMHFGLITSFTVVPPLIIQRKDSASDLQSGTGSKWRGVLRDSTWDRVRRDMGEVVVDEVWNPNPKTWDPARRIRGTIRCKDDAE